MKLAHCNNHLDATEDRLCCMALRDDEGHVLSPEKIWAEFQKLRKENDDLREIINLGAEDGKRR